MKTILLVALAAIFVASHALADPPTDKPVTAALNAVCPTLEQEAELVDLIKEERANPTGVVNLRTLHELGQSLQFTREQLRDARKEHKTGLAMFRKIAKKPLDLTFCEEWDRRTGAGE
jgi:hypothetical protein